MSTVDSQLNWGASYLVSDFYKRFVKKEGSQSHYVRVSRILTFLLAGAGALVAFQIQSIGQVFTFVLNLTAGAGPVYLLRWFWWRVNAWSEIAAMSASLVLISLRSAVFSLLGLPPDPFLKLLYMVIGTGVVWIPVTLLTPAVPDAQLREFVGKVSPPGFWQGFGKGREEDDLWRSSLKLWLVGTASLLAALIGPIQILLGRWGPGLGSCGLAALGTLYVIFLFDRQRRSQPQLL
jgi:hypothetical protein